jgi:flagellar protein FliO/FliZ
VTSGGLSTAVQVLLSLGAVIAVVIVAARLVRRAGVRGPGAGLRVVDRTGLSRESSVAVVEVGGRALVLGVTAHNITLLTELPSTDLPSTDLPSTDLPAALDDENAERPAPTQDAREVAALQAVPRPRPADGSVLSPATWKQGMDALRELTARKG